MSCLNKNHCLPRRYSNQRKLRSLSRSHLGLPPEGRQAFPSKDLPACGRSLSAKRRFCVMLKTCGRGARKTKGSCAKARDVSFSRRRSGSSRGLLFWVVYCENISKNHCPRDSTRFVMYCLV